MKIIDFRGLSRADSALRIVAAMAFIPMLAAVIGCGKAEDTEVVTAPSTHSIATLTPTPGFAAPTPELTAPPAAAAAPKEEMKVAAAFPAETTLQPETSFLPESAFNPVLPPMPSLQTALRPQPTPLDAGIELDHPQVLKLEPQQVGEASIDTLKARNNSGAAGSRSFSHINDYLLKNDKISVVFAAVIRRDPEEKLKVVQGRNMAIRLPGSLVDIVTPKSRADFLTEFSQALEVEGQGSFFNYDSAEFVKREAAEGIQAAVGVRFTGSQAKDGAETRIQTSYWLAPGSTQVEVETAIVTGNADASIADFISASAGVLLSDIYGPPGPTDEPRDVEWLATHAGELSLGMAVPGGRMRGNFLRSEARVVGYAKEGDQPRPLRKRILYVGEGNFSSATDQIFSAPGFPHPVGVFKGTVRDKENDEPASEGWVDIFWYDRSVGPTSNKIYTRAEIKPDSTFSAILPCLDAEEGTGRYFVGAGSRSRQGGLSNMGIVVTPSVPVERELSLGPQGTLSIKCVDSKTNQPLVCRVRFEPVPPSPPSRFSTITSPKGYLDSVYCPREGTTIPMSKGIYTLTAIHGIHYELGQVDVEIDWNRESVATIPLEKTNPTPGWIGLHIGAMTNATPSCTLSAEDQILMTAGEGLDWIISGDLETITDFGPTIEKMGYKDLLGSTRGFRTFLPKRPEWGEFLLYPVAADAPDPKTVRDQWKDMTDSTQFFALLRKLYPGALLQSCHPYSDSLNKTNKNIGTGYFYHPGWTVYEMAFNDNQRTEKIDFGLDAVNLFSPRGDWSFMWDRDFYFIHTQHNRMYIPAPVSESRSAFLGEPGWPRLLVRTEEGDVTKLTTEKVIGDMKAGRWQVTSGPFIEFTADGRKEGDQFQPTDNKKVRFVFKVTAPFWASTTNIDFCKDGVMLWKDADNVEALPTATQRFFREDGVPLFPEHRGDSDTMLSGDTWSPRTIDVVARGSIGVGITTFAWNAPIFCDTNGNGKYDPPIYRDRGK